MDSHILNNSFSQKVMNSIRQTAKFVFFALD